jgi:hypothetical protein
MADLQGLRLRRLRFRYSLRGLLFAVLVVAAPLAWLAREWRIVHERAAIIQHVKASGGEVFLAEQQICWGGLWGQYPHIPKWRSWMGDKAVSSISAADDPQTAGETNNRLVRLFPEAFQRRRH